MSNFRPISLCSVIYKIIARMVVNRLRVVLDKCIDTTQSAFISSKLIIDNILVAYEILHIMVNKRFGQKGYMTLKLYMSKAYDRVE